MSVNRDRQHVLVLPEDDANLRLANGFHKQVDWDRYRQMQVLPVAAGWREVLSLFKSDYVADMDRRPARFMVLLIDFDEHEDRLTEANAAIPERLASRVFVLGAWSEPEDLKPELGDYETIGSSLGRDCREGTDNTWGHKLLQHNASELVRLRKTVRPILFPAN